MRCQKIRHLLSCRLDGVIDDDQLNKVVEHLGQCPACRSYWRYLQADAKMLKDLPEVAPSVEFRGELLAKLEDLGRSGIQPAPRQGYLPKFTWITGKPWLAGAAAVLIFVFGLTIFSDIPGAIREINGGPQISQVGDTHETQPDILNPNGPEKGQDIGNPAGSKTGVEPGQEPGKQDSEISGTGNSEAGTQAEVGAENSRPVTEGQNPSNNPPAVTEANPGSSEDGVGNSGKVGEFYTTSGDQIRVVKNVKIKLAVGDLEAADKQVNEVASAYCVTLEKGEEQDLDSEMRYTLCVPVAEMHGAKAKLEEIGRVIVSVFENDDITDKYTQLASNINEQNAKIAGLEKKVNECENEIERAVQEKQLGEALRDLGSLKYRLKGFDDALGMATINLTLVTKP